MQQSPQFKNMLMSAMMPQQQDSFGFNDPLQLANTVRAMAPQTEMTEVAPVGGIGAVNAGITQGSILGEATGGQKLGDLSAALMGSTPEEKEAILRYGNSQNNPFRKGSSAHGVMGIAGLIREKMNRKDYIEAQQAIQDRAMSESDREEQERYQNTLALAKERFGEGPTAEGVARLIMKGDLAAKEIIPDEASPADPREEMESNLRIAKLNQDLEKGQLTIDQANAEKGNEVYKLAEPSVMAVSKLDREYEILQQIQELGYESGAAQVGALYSMIKAFDPESVVREGEIALMEKAQAFIDSVEQGKTKITDPAAITEELFYDILDMADRLNMVQGKSHRKFIGYHIERARDKGINAVDAFGSEMVDQWDNRTENRKAASTPDAPPAEGDGEPTMTPERKKREDEWNAAIGAG